MAFFTDIPLNGHGLKFSAKLFGVPLTPIPNPKLERQEAIASGARLRAMSVFACVAAGFLIAAKLGIGIHPGWFAGIGCLLAAAALVAKRWFLAFGAAALMCLAGSYYQMRVQWRDPAGLSARIDALVADSPARAAIVKVRGTVATNLRIAPKQGPPLGQFLHQNPAARCVIEVEDIWSGGSWERAAGKLWMKVDLPPDAMEVPRKVAAGDSVEVVGMARGMGKPTNPGEFDSVAWAIDHGFAGSVALSSMDLVVKTEARRSWLQNVRGTWTAFKEGLAVRARSGMERATAGFTETQRTLVLALVLGDTPTDESLNQAFMRLGLAHVLAISGFHLVVMIQMFLVLLRLTGDRGRMETVIAMLLVILYMFMVPAQAPIVRSGWTFLALLAAEWIGRRYDTVTLLVWVSAALAIMHPTDVWSLGYQLSCGLTVLLIWLGQHARNTLFVPRIRGIVRPQRSVPQIGLRWAIEQFKVLVSTTFLCGLAAVPWIAARTGTVSPMLVVATVVVVPPLTVLLWVAFLALAVGIISPPLVDHVAPALEVASDGIVRLISAVDSLPLTHFRAVRPDVALALCASTLVIAWFVRRRKRERLMWALTSVLLVWYGAEVGVHTWRESQRVLRIDMLDVGDGSCLVVRSGGKAILWDAGSLRRGMGSDTIIRALTEMDVTRLDAVYMSHPDIDHFGGLPAIVTAFKVQDVYTCDRFISQAEKMPDGAAGSLMRLAKEAGCEFRVSHDGNVSVFGNVTLEMLSPPAPEPEWTVDNEHSLVMLIKSGEEQLALLTGDLQDQGLARLRRAHSGLSPIVLELPHHGSFSATAKEFAGELGATIVLQSTSQRREGDVRWSDVRRSVQAWYTTSADGASFVEFGKDGRVTTGGFGVKPATLTPRN